jgi:hypothetical protein
MFYKTVIIYIFNYYWELDEFLFKNILASNLLSN